MALLTTTTRTPLERQADQLRAAPRAMLLSLIADWHANYDLLWTASDDITPAQRLAELSTSGAELFARSAAAVTFILNQLGNEDPAESARIMAKIGNLPALDVAQDGTVSIVPQPEPEPAP